MCLQELERRLADGYCLHGSKQQLLLLEPRQAYCSSGRPESCLNAVYAERKDVQVPIIMALWAGKGTGSYSGNGTFLRVEGDRTFSPGYVHVLSTKSFQDVHGEFVSFEPVRSEEIIPVTPSILWELLGRGTLDLHIPIPAPW